MQNTELTILIQGRLQKECIEFYSKNYKDYNLVISTWKDSLQDCRNEIDNILSMPNVKVLINEPPINRGNQNYFYHVVSTLNGLNQINTDYCIKIRGDEYYSNIKYILDCLKSKSDLIHTLPIYFNYFNVHPYHISDHLIAGKTKNLLTMFYSAYKKIEKYQFNENVLSCEQGLCRAYIESIEPEMIEWEEVRDWNFLLNSLENHKNGREIMKKYFNIINIDEIKPYLVSVNVLNKKYYNEFKNSGPHSIEDI